MTKLNSVRQILQKILHFKDFRWVVLLFILSTIVVMAPVIFSPTMLRASDSAFHIYNSRIFLEELQSGVIYPRWLGEWYGGYGAPIGLFSPPLVYQVTALLGLVGLPIVTAIKIILWMSVFVSGLAFYGLMIQHTRPIGALAGGLFYQVAPYHVFDLYGRGAYPEFIGFMWLPLLLLLIHLAIKKRSLIFYIGFAWIVGILILTHLLTAYLFAPIVVLFGIWSIWRNSQEKLTDLFRVTIAGLAGATLAGVYWLPALLENQYSNTSWFPEQSIWGNLYNNFLFDTQTYLELGWTSIHSANMVIGVGSLFCLGITIVVLVVNTLDWKKRDSLSRELTLFMVVIAGFSLFMSFSISKPLWAIFPRADVVQFPWRWQTVTTLAVAYLVGDAVNWLLETLTSKAEEGRRPAIALFLLIGLVMGASIVSVVSMRIYRNQLSTELIEQILGRASLETENFDYVYDNPYLTQWSKDFDYVEVPASDSPSVVSDIPIDLNIIDWQSAYRAFTVDVTQSTMINIRTFWFPGWMIEVNGEDIIPDIHLDDGTMLVPVDEGESNITMTFVDTPVRQVGNIMTILTGLILIGLSIFAGVHHNRLSSATET